MYVNLAEKNQLLVLEGNFGFKNLDSSFQLQLHCKYIIGSVLEGSTYFFYLFLGLE